MSLKARLPPLPRRSERMCAGPVRSDAGAEDQGKTPTPHQVTAGAGLTITDPGRSPACPRKHGPYRCGLRQAPSWPAFASGHLEGQCTLGPAGRRKVPPHRRPNQLHDSKRWAQKKVRELSGILPLLLKTSAPPVLMVSRYTS